MVSILLSLPTSPYLTPARAHSASLRHSAMVLKRSNLEGGSVDKSYFRGLYSLAEQSLASDTFSLISPLSRFMIDCIDVKYLRSSLLSNFDFICSKTSDLPLNVIVPFTHHQTPYNFTFTCASRQIRDQLRSFLITNRIYPSILWSLDTPVFANLPTSTLQLSDTILSLHCDYRYRHSDLDLVIDALCTFFLK